MRLFKVYNAEESDSELVFAKSHRQAASIARAVWYESGCRCRHFKVVELQLPDGIKDGTEWDWFTNQQRCRKRFVCEKKI